MLDIIIEENDPKVIEAKVKTLLETYTEEFKIKNKIIGQDQAVKLLTSSIKQNKISHAYLFCGGRGMVKTETPNITGVLS